MSSSSGASADSGRTSLTSVREASVRDAPLAPFWALIRQVSRRVALSTTRTETRLAADRQRVDARLTITDGDLAIAQVGYEKAGR